MGEKYTPEKTMKTLMTRLMNVAYWEGVSLGALIQYSDRELARMPNLGAKAVALARELRRPHALWFWEDDGVEEGRGLAAAGRSDAPGGGVA